MRITKKDQTKTVEFKNLKGGDFFIYDADEDLMVKLVNEVEENNLIMNSFSIKSRNLYSLEDYNLCIPIEIEEIVYKEI